MIDMQKVEILGIPVFAGPLDHAIDCVMEQCIAPAQEMNLRISATGAHGLVITIKNKEFRLAWTGSFFNLPFAMPGKLYFKNQTKEIQDEEAT
jgi:hypothetical protein